MQFEEEVYGRTYKNLKKRVYALVTKVRFWLGIYFIYLVLIMPSSCSLDSDTVTKQIDNKYYFTYFSSGLFATTSSYFHINVYQNRDWWLDREMADIIMPVSGSSTDTIEVTYRQERLRIFIRQELKMDTLIPEGQSVRIN